MSNLNVEAVERMIQNAVEDIDNGNSADAEAKLYAAYMTVADFNMNQPCNHRIIAVIGNEETGVKCNICGNCGRRIEERMLNGVMSFVAVE